MRWVRASVCQRPLVGWLLSALVAVTLEPLVGAPVALALGLPRVPVLFGFLIMFATPTLIPSAILYTLCIYAVPIAGTAWLGTSVANRLPAPIFLPSKGLSGGGPPAPPS